MFYLNKILRRKFLDSLYTITRFYLYDLKNGIALIVVSTVDDSNVSKFTSTFFFVISNLMVLKQCSCGIYFPNQLVTKYRTHP
jgi:hypothetical protein